MPPRQVFGVLMTVTKTFAPHVPGQRAVLQRIGARAARMIRERVEKRGRHAYGSLPEVDSDGWFVVSAKRYPGASGLEPRNIQGEHGVAPSLAIDPAGYLHFKRGRGGRSRQGQSLTGSMWRSLKVTVSSRGTAHKRITVGFSDSEVVDVVPDPSRKSGKRRVRISNRDKATALQYAHRTKAGSPTGRRSFALMALTAAEVQQLSRDYLSKVRLFRARAKRIT